MLPFAYVQAEAERVAAYGTPLTVSTQGEAKTPKLACFDEPHWLGISSRCSDNAKDGEETWADKIQKSAHQ
jgi:hypothetical protein